MYGMFPYQKLKMAHPSTRAKSKMLSAFIVFISASYLELKTQKRFYKFLSFFLVYDKIPWRAAKNCILSLKQQNMVYFTTDMAPKIMHLWPYLNTVNCMCDKFSSSEFCWHVKTRYYRRWWCVALMASVDQKFKSQNYTPD